MALRLRDLKGVNLQGFKPGRPRYPVVSKPRRTLDGIVFDSANEMRRYAALKVRLQAGLIADLKRQVPLVVKIEGERFCKLTVDFSYVENGVLIYEDAKSTGTQKDKAYRLRKRAAELYFGIRVQEVFAK